MKKQSWAIHTLAGAAIISLSACQPVTSLGDMWSSDTSDNSPTSAQPTSKTSTAHTHRSSVPHSYYLATGKPLSHADVDKNWVTQQHSSGYTIQLATGKASSVAQTLQAAPKDHRMAQVPYNDDGKPMYIGVYGSFASKSDAEAALEKLPTDMQSTAKIESWHTVQEAANSISVSEDTSSIAPPEVQ